MKINLKILKVNIAIELAKAFSEIQTSSEFELEKLSILIAVVERLNFMIDKFKDGTLRTE